jgi:methionyl aminopeptidase
MEVKHGTWTFDYSPEFNLYSNDIESYEKQKFNHVELDTDNKLDKEEERIMDYRKAGMIHKEVRKYAKSLIINGQSLSNFVDKVEMKILELTGNNKNYYLKGNKDSGIAFPIGVNINNIVAHDSKLALINDKRVFKDGDVIKVDIGVHIRGRVIDSAFTHVCSSEAGISKDGIYNNLLEASRESVFEAIKLSGPDQSLYEISEMITEIISSYEIDVGGETAKIRPVHSVGGHNMNDYELHGGKLIFSVPNEEIQDGQRMEENEIYAIETFATTGMGVPKLDDSYNKVTHFNLMPNDVIDSIKQINGKDKSILRKSDLYKWMKTRNGLPFSSSWLPKGLKKVQKAFKVGLETGQILSHPPIIDEETARVAQFEHTIRVQDGIVEIFSIGEDY